MITIPVNGPHPYEIRIAPGSIRDIAAANAALVVSDTNVARWYEVLPDTPHHLIEPGESSKNFRNYEHLMRKLAEVGARRDSELVAVGGGVVGDLAGFAAATWMRGIKYIQVPTTLLAMVDSSVGGKTAIDLDAAKNLVGAFHPPALVIIDPEVLDTLPSREFNAGMAEVIKYGMVFDGSFLSWIEDNADFIGARDAETMQELIARGVTFKRDVVERDPFEQGERALLNFGHTFAHAIEAEQEYGELNHGEAVAVGMVLATRMSGLDPARLINLLRKFNLPVSVAMDPARLLARMQLDKKATHTGLRLILLDKYGSARIATDIAPDSVLGVLQA